MTSQIPINELTEEEEERLQRALTRLRQEVLERRAEGRPAGVIIRVNLCPAKVGQPAMIRGHKWRVEGED